MPKHGITVAALLLGIATVMPALGQPAGAAKKTVLPSFDARDRAAAGETAGARQARDLVARRTTNLETFLAAEAAANPGTRIVPNRYGVPKLFLRDGKPLSGPASGDPEQIAREFLRAHAALFPFTASEVDNLRLVVKDATGSATFVAFSQTVEGIDVFEGQIKFTLSAAGEVVETAAGELVPGVNVSTTPRLSPEEAVRAALAAIGVRAAGALARTAGAEGKTRFRSPRGDRFNPTTVELSIFPLTAASARLAYRILIDADASGYYEILIDAEDGSLLYRRNLYVHAAQGTVWTQSPLVGAARTVASFPPASNPFPDPWLPAAANGTGGAGWVTTGNNTDTSINTYGADVPDPVNSSVMQSGRAYSAGQDFTFPFGDGTLGLDPRNYQAAAVANLFYYVNLAHDYYYGLGFTETAGNFQTNNYGRGGTGNDSVKAEAQFGALDDDSDFSPTPEGTQPHLRMGIFTHSTLTLTDDRDADYDGEVAFHEYGHGLSNRLVGAKVSTSCLANMQSGAMGEGWSDYFSISFFNNPVEGAYIGYSTVSGARRYSYEGYPYTYADIGNQGYEVHNDGEIWAATLWDLRKSLGQAVTDQLVVNGLKSTPCNPSMTDARDAILAADAATSAGAHRAAIWQIFAKHGMGYSALGVDGDFSTGERYDAAFDQPPDLQALKNPAITSNPLAAVPSMGVPYQYQVTATNPNGGALTYALTSGPAGMTVSSAAGLVNWNPTFVGQRVQITVTDGKGGEVVHGYFLPVVTAFSIGTPLGLAGAEGSTGYATLAVPANTPVLQVTLRGGTGDADLWITDPSGNYSGSANYGNTETLTFANPIAGTWQIEVDGYLTYAGVALSAAVITPYPIGADGVLSGLSGVMGSETLYRIAVPAGAARLLVATSGGTGDVDIFLRLGQPAVCQDADYVYEDCLYDFYSAKDGNAESISVASPSAGDYYLDLSAYEAYSGVTLTTSTAATVLAITTSSPLPAGAVGAVYSQTLTAKNGSPPYSWSAAPGSLPAGLTLSSGGVLFGSPTTAGTFSFTIVVQDTTSATASATLSLTIGSALAVSTSSPLLSGFTNGAFYQTLTAAGGAPPYVWSLTSGALPAGLALGAGGAISGTPTAAGPFNFTAQVKDSGGAVATKAFTLTVVAGGTLARVGVLSQFAAGGYWDTAVWIMNNSSAAVPVRLVFRGDDGTQVLKSTDGATVAVPLTVTQQGDTETVTVTTVDRVINPNTTLVVAGGLGLSSKSAQGWVDVLATAAVSGFAVFRYAPNGLTAPPLPWTTAWFTPWEGTVPLQTPGSSSTLILPFDNTSGFSTGVALGSYSGSAASIAVNCYDNSGNALGTPQTIPLNANGHTSFMVGSQYSVTANTRGIVKFTGVSLMGLGLRASPYGTLTSVPAVLQ